MKYVTNIHTSVVYQLYATRQIFKISYPLMIFLYLCDTQNHKIVRIGRDLWSSHYPTIPAQVRPLEPIAHDYVQIAFEHLQDSIISLDKLMMRGHLHSKKSVS